MKNAFDKTCYRESRFSSEPPKVFISLPRLSEITLCLNIKSCTLFTQEKFECVAQYFKFIIILIVRRPLFQVDSSENHP